MKPLSSVEAKKIVETTEENKEIKSFLKKFIKLDLKRANELRKELEASGILKLKDEYIVKIIDLMPEDVADINKIFSDVSLDENETNKLLEVIKKYR